MRARLLAESVSLQLCDEDPTFPLAVGWELPPQAPNAALSSEDIPDLQGLFSGPLLTPESHTDPGHHPVTDKSPELGH